MALVSMMMGKEMLMCETWLFAIAGVGPYYHSPYYIRAVDEDEALEKYYRHENTPKTHVVVTRMNKGACSPLEF